MNNLWQDIRFGVRMLARSPGLTAVMVLTLAIGIGANTAIFSVIDGVLFKALPYRDPHRLAFLWGKHVSQGEEPQQISYLDFSDIRDRNEVFEDMAAIWVQSWALTGDGEAERMTGLLVSPSIFPMLGVEAAHGRTLLPEEAQPGKDRVVVISHRLWQNRFGGASDILGRAITLNGDSYNVVGVLPQGFDLEFPISPTFSIGDNDVWIPLTSTHRLASNRGIFTYEVIGRLKRDVSIEQAQANLATIGEHLRQAYPDTNSERSFTIVSAHEQIVGNIRPVLLMLLSAVGLVLLVTCANIANLLLGRATARRKEIAVRVALGAGRLRIARQLITESLLLSIAGGTAGLILALWSIDLIVKFPGVNLPRIDDIRIDSRVLTFTLALSILTGLIFGLAPALLSRSDNLRHLLNEGGSRVAGGGLQRLRNALIISEIALAFVLLVGAGLLTSSFLSLLRVNPGFDTANVLTFAVTPSASRYKNMQQYSRFYSELIPSIESLPKVQAVSVVSSLPFSGHNSGSSALIEGRSLPPGEQPPVIGWQTVMPGYFNALKVPLVRGRNFTEEDRTRPQHLTIINQALADTLFPGEDPIGKRVTFGVPDTEIDWHEIIGVVGDVRHLGLDSRPQPRAYDLFGQHGSRSLYVVVRTEGDPMQLLGSIRSKVSDIDTQTPIFNIATLDELIARSTASRRFSMLLVGGFALLALMLAAIGIYGVLSYFVSQRTREIGVRIALGAEPRDVVKLILGQGLVLTLAGLLTGIAASFALTRFISGLLFGVSPVDAQTFAIISVLLTVVAMLACYLPARRASRVDPITALRYE